MTVFFFQKSSILVWKSVFRFSHFNPHFTDSGSSTSIIYWNVEKKCRDLIEKMIIFVILNSMITFASLFWSFYSLATGNFDTSTWNLPFDLVVPFEMTSVFRWYLLWLYNLLCNLGFAACLASTSSYFVCCCFYLGGVCKLFWFVNSGVWGWCAAEWTWNRSAKKSTTYWINYKLSLQNDWHSK